MSGWDCSSRTKKSSAQVRNVFGLHELAVEDALNLHMRPKIERYDPDVQLVILRTARYDDDAEEVEFGEISVFLSPRFVIAVRQGVASELREARQRLEQRPELLAAGSSSALWAIMDQVVDGYAPVIAGLEHDIDQIEATVFSGAVAATERIYSLRSEATDFYRAVHPLLAVTGIVERAAHKKLRPYFRDVRDHLLLVDEEVTDQRDLLGTVLQANMAVISVDQTKLSLQQNSTIEQLTILATVFLPLTFVTGFFGQNFGWLVRHIDGPAMFIVYGHRRPGAAAGPVVHVAEAPDAAHELPLPRRPAADRDALLPGVPGSGPAQRPSRPDCYLTRRPDGGRLSNALAAESWRAWPWYADAVLITLVAGATLVAGTGRRHPGG